MFINYCKLGIHLVLAYHISFICLPDIFFIDHQNFGALFGPNSITWRLGAPISFYFMVNLANNEMVYPS